MLDFRRRFNTWLSARLPATDSLLLTQRNVYILPTRPGWMLALTLLVMLVGSINEQLNLGYLLTFLLAGCAAAGVHVSHGTLRGLTLHMAPPAPCFAGTAAHLQLTLGSTRSSTRYGIGLAVSGQTDWAHVDVPAQGSTTVTVGWQPPGRGRHALPALKAETRFPLGTFRVWTVWRPAATVLAYPAPENAPPPLPPGVPKAGTAATAPSAPGAEFDGVRAYRRGDPLKAVVWKRVAQAMARGSDDLVSRDHASAQQTHELWLDWAHTGTADTELRASRLTAWVLQAERLGMPYGLRLPGREFPPNLGGPHRLQCLEALALC
jgi:uncharacterized protein (DUF58 family)